MGKIGRTLFGGPEKKKESSTSSSSSGNYAYGPVSAALGPAMGYTTQSGNMLGSLLGLNTYQPSPAVAPNYSPSPVYGGSSQPQVNPGKQNSLIRVRPNVDQTLDNPDVFNENNFYQSHPSQVSPPVPTGDNQTSALDQWANSGGMQFLREQGIKAIEGSRAGRGLLQSGDTATELLKFGQGLGSTYLNQYMDQLLNHAKLGLGAAGVVGSTGAWSKSSGQSSGKAEGEKKGIAPMIASAIAGGA